MAGSARDIQMRELKDTISELNKLIKTLQQTIEAANAREAALCQERDNLKEQMDYLTKRLFGASSEKGKCDIPGQLDLFNEAETAEDPVAALSEEALPSWEEPEAKPRKKRAANEERLKGLPVEQVFLDVPEEERICGVCGTLMETIGTEFVRRELKFIPAKVKVIEYYSVNYGCPKCRKEAVLPQIKKGKGGRAHRIHGMASTSTVARIMYQKYFNGMPLYRQERGLETVRCKHQQNNLRQLDYRECTGFFHSHVCLLPKETACTVICDGGRNASPGAA